MNFIEKFNYGLKKSSSFLSFNLLNALSSKKIDNEMLEEIESILLSCDIGIEVTNQLINKIQSINLKEPENFDSVLKVLSDEIEFILKPKEKSLIEEKDHKPTILIFIGVNGSGKTTTIGKLVNTLLKNKKVLVAACDTFRAAAVEQLKQLTINQYTDLYQGSLQQDPASVAYNACQKALNESYDYLIIDTAGRLSNNTNLLNQLIKIQTVVKKIIEEDNIKTTLVLDGTNGSNMIKQVDTFGKSVDINGLIITKIDGTAKGGALIAIAKKYETPINFVGLGEKMEDLYKFDAKNFAKSILGVK